GEGDFNGVFSMGLHGEGEEEKRENSSFEGSWVGLGQLTWGTDYSRNDSWCYPTSRSLILGPWLVVVSGWVT
ncbi:hypothetical protein HAX54_002384, partial [Datura stramonium]|nr:hypothetical protein [Datura stramonium]